MKTRLISSLIALAIAFFAVCQFNNIILNILGIIVFSIAISEIYNAFKDGNVVYFVPILFLFGSCVMIRPYLMISPMILMSLLVVAFVMLVVFNFTDMQFKAIASGMLYGLYVLFGLYSIARLKIVMPFDNFGWDGAFLFVLSGAIAWGGDVMAYFGGYFFGKHKLAPKLSPKKTIEGAVGGVLGSIFFAIAMFLIYIYVKPIVENSGIAYTLSISKLAIVVIIAAIGSMLGILGDLFASAIKRQCGIKDYGYIMPGHGGVLDRFDSILLVTPFISVVADFIVLNGGIL